MANQLMSDGIDVKLDQYDVALGDRLPLFMEQSITNSDYVLVICTPNYKEKADNRQSGVGYEGHIISEELISSRNEKKFIPLIRKGSIQEGFPTFLKEKLGVDFTTESNFQQSYDNLLATLYGAKQKPSIGTIPERFNKTLKVESVEKDEINEVKIIGIITDEVTIPLMDGTRGSALYTIPFRLTHHFFLVLPCSNTLCMNAFLAELSLAYAAQQIILICDNATWHRSKALIIPENILIVHIPPYTPEMNPIEQVWRELRKPFANKVFSSLDKVIDHLCTSICSLSNDLVYSIIHRNWLIV